jgi:hypothetical protein
MNEHLKNVQRKINFSSHWTTDNVYGNDLRFGSVALNTKDLSERKRTNVVGTVDRCVKYKWNKEYGFKTCRTTG